MQFAPGTGALIQVLQHSYLDGPQGQVLAAEVFGQDSSGQAHSAENFWLLSDQQGTVWDVAQGEGFLRAHIDYDSVGRVTSQQSYILNGGSAGASSTWVVDELFG